MKPRSRGPLLSRDRSRDRLCRVLPRVGGGRAVIQPSLHRGYHRLLVRRMVPDRAPVLIARHRERHGIVLPPKLQHQLLVGHPSRIELHAKRLGVIADGLVRGVRRSAAGVAHHRAPHPGKSSKALLGVPESSHGKRGRLTLLRLLWLRQPRAFAGHHAQRLVPSHRSTSHRSTSSQARGSRRKQQQHLCGVVRRAARLGRVDRPAARTDSFVRRRLRRRALPADDAL